jgi:hypothetical protein
MKYLPRYFKIYFVFQTYCEANNIARHNRYFHSHCPVMSHHNLMYSLHTNTHNEYQCINVAYFFLVFCVVLLCVFMFWVMHCDVRYDFRIKTMFIDSSSLPPIICRRVHVLFTLFVLFAYSGVQHILCCAFVLFVFVLPNVASFSGLSIFDCPSVFSYVYCSWTINWQLFTLQTFATLEYILCSGSTSMAVSRKKNRTLSTTSNDPTNWGATKDINKIVYK